MSIAQSQGSDYLSYSQCSRLSGFVGSHERLCEHDYIFGLAQLRLNISSASQDRELLGAIQVLCTALLVWKRCVSPGAVSSP